MVARMRSSLLLLHVEVSLSPSQPDEKFQPFLRQIQWQRILLANHSFIVGKVLSQKICWPKTARLSVRVSWITKGKLSYHPHSTHPPKKTLQIKSSSYSKRWQKIFSRLCMHSNSREISILDSRAESSDKKRKFFNINTTDWSCMEQEGLEARNHSNRLQWGESEWWGFEFLPAKNCTLLRVLIWPEYRKHSFVPDLPSNSMTSFANI